MNKCRSGISGPGVPAGSEVCSRYGRTYVNQAGINFNDALARRSGCRERGPTYHETEESVTAFSRNSDPVTVNEIDDG